MGKARDNVRSRDMVRQPWDVMVAGGYVDYIVPLLGNMMVSSVVAVCTAACTLMMLWCAVLFCWP